RLPGDRAMTLVKSSTSALGSGRRGRPFATGEQALPGAPVVPSDENRCGAAPLRWAEPSGASTFAIDAERPPSPGTRCNGIALRGVVQVGVNLIAAGVRSPGR